MALISAILLCSIPFVTPVSIGARTLSLDGIVQHLNLGDPGVSGWGGVFLTDSVLNDTGGHALAILRHAGRHIKSRVSCPLVRLSLVGGVTSATAKYSETGEGASSIPVTMPTQEGLAWDEIPVLGRYYSVRVLARVGGQCAPSSPGKALEQEHELTFTVGTPDGDVNVIAHTFTSRTRELLEGEEEITGGEGAAVAAAAAAAAGEAVVVGADGEASLPPPLSTGSPLAVAEPLRILSYNVWNVNPPRYLHRDAKDRFRAYALRMLYLGEIVRASGAGIVAFQEVRYDSGLGGFPGDAPQTHNPWVEGARGGPPKTPQQQQQQQQQEPASPLLSPAQLYQGVLDGVVSEGVDPSKPIHAHMPPVARGNPYTMAVAWAVSSMWFNKTLVEISQSAQYRERNAEKWGAVKSAPGWGLFGGESYPWEGGESTPPTTAPPSISEADGNTTTATTGGNSDGGSGGNPGGPYHQPPPKGPRSWSELQGAFLEHPHAQIEHLAASLPGYQYVHVPAQLYLDRDVWGRAEGPGKGSQQRDEEGPAIFSRWPILHSDYLLLSRNTSDEGDTHQRLCLHAVIDATPTSPTHARTLVDVYTVHLSLSEAARNRSVPELLAFIKESARGDVVMLTGDMNAEPHEPAMRALTAAGVVIVHPPPPPPPTPTPTPLPPPTEGGGEGGEGNATSSTTPEGSGEGGGELVTPPTPLPTPVTVAPPENQGRAAPAVVVEPVVMGKGGRPLLTPPTPLRVFHHKAEGQGEGNTAAITPGGGEEAVGDEEHGVVSTLPLLCDTWRALYPEPLRSDPDASARRFALTFPSDDPIKRIDMQFLGCGPGMGMGGEGSDIVHPVTSESQPHCSAQLAACGVKVGRTWTVGADPVPGTDMGEGKGFGMLHERSAWYASDHRGVVVELEVV